MGDQSISLGRFASIRVNPSKTEQYAFELAIQRVSDAVRHGASLFALQAEGVDGGLREVVEDEGELTPELFADAAEEENCEQHSA